MRQRVALHLAAATVVALVLTPLLAPGYVLSYDMNFVPDQPLRWDLLAPTDTAPRAVPLDAAVSLADSVVPGWLLQRLVLVGIVWAAVVGAGRLVPAQRLGTRLIAGVGYGWTPLLAERLLIGQWGLLLAYAALPWLVSAVLELRQGRDRGWPKLLLAAGVSALTPTGGLIAAVACLTLLAGAPWRRFGAAIAALTVLNSPWLLAAALADAGTRSDPAGVAAFAARGENWSGPIGALLSTGGIWNAETTPASRSSVVVPLVTLTLLVLAGAGCQALHRRLPGTGRRLIAVALGGLLCAAVATVPPGAALLRWLIESVPGAGLLRDGQKFVLPYALVLVLCVALGVERLVAGRGVAFARVGLAGALLLPVVAMPDLVYGGAGALRPVRYPADWARVAALLSGQEGEVLALPLSEYRRYPWNRDRVVIDPAPRYLPLPVVTDDRLVVGALTVAGENPRLERIRQLISAGDPVAATGIGWVLVARRGPGHEPVPAGVLAGLETRYVGDQLILLRNPQATDAGDRRRDGLAVIVAEIAALALLLGSVTALVLSRIHRSPRRSGPDQT